MSVLSNKFKLIKEIVRNNKKLDKKEKIKKNKVKNGRPSNIEFSMTLYNTS